MESVELATERAYGKAMRAYTRDYNLENDARDLVRRKTAQRKADARIALESRMDRKARRYGLSALVASAE